MRCHTHLKEEDSCNVDKVQQKDAHPEGDAGRWLEAHEVQQWGQPIPRGEDHIGVTEGDDRQHSQERHCEKVNEG